MTPRAADVAVSVLVLGNGASCSAILENHCYVKFRQLIPSYYLYIVRALNLSSLSQASSCTLPLYCWHVASLNFSARVKSKKVWQPSLQQM